MPNEFQKHLAEEQQRKVYLRQMNVLPSSAVVQGILAAVALNASRSDLFKTCVSCEHWSYDSTEMCKKFNVRPPAKVIADACEHYVDNFDIPF